MGQVAEMIFVAFDLDTIKLLMNIFVRNLIVPESYPVPCSISVVCIQDTDRSGTIGFNEVSNHDLFLCISGSKPSSVCWTMEVHQGMCGLPSRTRMGVLKKTVTGLAGRVPSFRPGQIRHDRWPRAGTGTEPIRLQAHSAAPSPLTTQIWCEHRINFFLPLFMHSTQM